ncbi:MAG: TAT-variant-translocated molybdopterin oxidoreductase [Flavobacteriales bacterium]|nr:TAT-variant-translocated molybdopterin oxidoreductase [Flavobacteriales bacterium]
MSNLENKYWKGIEELEKPAQYAGRTDEFSDKLPMEEIFGDSDEITSNRRDFLKFFGFSVSAVALAACNRTPVKYAMPYIEKPANVTPGLPLYYATSCGAFNEGFPVVAKVREGRPIKLDGNEKSILSQGGLNAIGQASILSLYDINRLQNPKIGGKTEKDWANVDKKVAEILKQAAGKGVAVVSRTVTSPILKDAIDKFKTAHNATHIVYDPISYSGILNANKESFGVATVPNYKFDKAELIVSFGADFLGTWVSPVRFSSDYAKNRVPSPENANMSRHYQIEANMSLTGTNADYRFAIPASKHGAYLVSLYNMVASKVGGSSVSGAQNELAGNMLSKIAEELVAAKGKALVVCGSNNKADQIITNAINTMLDSYGNTIDINTSYNVSAFNEAEFDNFAKQAGSLGAVIFLNCNPVYSYANGKDLADSLKKTNVICTSIVADETSMNATVNAPDNHFLESWDIYEPMSGHYLTSQPTITKVFNTRSAAESLRTWAGETLEMGEDQVSRSWVVNYLESNLGVNAEQALHDGVVEKAASNGAGSFSGSVSDAAAAIASAKKGDGLELSLYQKVGIGDGTMAMNPWCHEMPDPVTKVTYDNYVTISRSDAEANNWEQGDWMKVTSSNGTVDKLPLLIQPGQAVGTIGIALGYGRTPEILDENKNDLVDLGKNVYPLVQTDNGTYSYVVSGVKLEKVGSGYEFAQTQTHHMVEGRDIMRETTLSEYQKEKDAGNKPQAKTQHLVSLWEEFDYSKGHHWAMAVDMNACTGCGSCIVSCSLENNVPIVGRDEVRRRREMHWIRIDRYYAFEVQEETKVSVKFAGERDFKKGDYSSKEKELNALDEIAKKGGKNDYSHYNNVTVVHQPMMCQHCDHAPCETVCPVLATTHSSEGLNQMTYNRCIGTKYCGNNCPYKVRRFNWFKYNDNSKFNYHFNNELGRMVLNPDVTVRSRGVMEKCSFCVQNIQMAKLKAKIENRKLNDGDVTVACAKTCPSNALVFGDRNDPNSKIAQMYKNERGYLMLEEVGIQPSVKYLTKIRNKKQEVQHS